MKDTYEYWTFFGLCYAKRIAINIEDKRYEKIQILGIKVYEKLTSL